MENEQQPTESPVKVTDNPIPGDPANVEFVNTGPVKVSSSAKIKLNAPPKTPVTETAVAQEAQAATSPHVPPVNLTPDSNRNGESYLGGMPVVLNAVTGTVGPKPATEARFVLDEYGNTMDAEVISGAAFPHPGIPPVKVEVVATKAETKL